MGIALGCIGLSHDDFCRLTGDQFAAVYKAWAEQREGEYKDNWHRMRLHASVLIQPHLAKGRSITPEKLIPLPWDKRRTFESPKMTADQQRARMRTLAEQLKDK